MSDPYQPIWINSSQVVSINKVAVADKDEPHFVRDAGLLDGALNRAYSMWCYDREEDLLRLAVRLLRGIAQAHAFEQGNKRTALLAALVFAHTNGIDLLIADNERVAILIEELVAGDEAADHALWQEFRKVAVLVEGPGKFG